MVAGLTMFDPTTGRNKLPPYKKLTVHWLLDSSGSMHKYADSLIEAVGHYLEYLKGASPLGQGQFGMFSSTVKLGDVAPWTQLRLPVEPSCVTDLYGSAAIHGYRANGGTALFDAVGDLATQTHGPGQHILVIVSDGEDNASKRWSAAQCRAVIETLQDESAWTAVFLGAFPDALLVAASIGIRPGNALVFPGTALPEAFQALTRATQAVLGQVAREKRLIGASGLFDKE